MTYTAIKTWIEVDYAVHPIRPYCKEEKCVTCGADATHKIAETTGPTMFHPFTAYVCCEHFFANCASNYPYGSME